MIVRSLPYDISVLILKCISLKVLYVSIFLDFSFLLLLLFSQRYKIKSHLSSVSEEKPIIH